jgi:hypothetical protein
MVEWTLETVRDNINAVLRYILFHDSLNMSCLSLDYFFIDENVIYDRLHLIFLSIFHFILIN